MWGQMHKHSVLVREKLCSYKCRNTVCALFLHPFIGVVVAYSQAGFLLPQLAKARHSHTINCLQILQQNNHVLVAIKSSQSTHSQGNTWHIKGIQLSKCAFDCMYNTDTVGVYTAKVIHTL